jgi:hypothetical protein
MMGIIVNTRRIISRLLKRPKNLFSLQVRQAICEGQFGCVICHYHNKFSRIIQPLGLLQQQLISIKTMTKQTTLQILSIQCKLFESTNVVIKVPRFPDYFNHMLCTVLAKLQVGISAHSSSLNFCKIKKRKDEKNLKFHNTNGSIDGVQMEF